MPENDLGRSPSPTISIYLKEGCRYGLLVVELTERHLAELNACLSDGVGLGLGEVLLIEKVRISDLF